MPSRAACRKAAITSSSLSLCCHALRFSWVRSKPARALLAGYQGVRPLTEGEVDAMPLLARGAARAREVVACYSAFVAALLELTDNPKYPQVVLFQLTGDPAACKF